MVYVQIFIDLHKYLPARDFERLPMRGILCKRYRSFMSPLSNMTYDAIGCLSMLKGLWLVEF